MAREQLLNLLLSTCLRLAEPNGRGRRLIGLNPRIVMRCSLTANDDVFKSSGQARDGHLSAVVRHVQQPVTVAVSVAPAAVTVAPGRVRQSVASWCGSTKTPGSEDQPEDSAATPAKQGSTAVSSSLSGDAICRDGKYATAGRTVLEMLHETSRLRGAGDTAAKTL
jgi:hypothetical protein